MAGERVTQVPVEAESTSGLRTEGRGITTYTNPTLRENADKGLASLASVTGPAGVFLGLPLLITPLAPVGIGLIGGGIMDGVGKGEAEADQSAERNNRLLHEARTGNHKVVINNAPDQSTNPNEKGAVALKPGYVEIIKHDVQTGVTVVDVKHHAFPHEGTIVIGSDLKNKDAAKAA